MRLSIILPVYNVEDYLERCIRSLEEQDIAHNEYEIIVVNDGSPDNSREVVLRLMREFENIVFIEQENKGVSMARNAGIDNATGRYLLFVDPDDYVLRDSLHTIITKATSIESQVIFLTYRFLDVEGDAIWEIFNAEYEGYLYSGIDAYTLSRGDGKADPDRTWGILFERNFIEKNHLRYISQIPYLEDGEFIARVMCLAERASFISKSFYMRTTRIGSATNSNLFYQDRAIKGFILAATNLVHFKALPNLTSEQKVFLNQPIAKFLTLVLIPSCNVFAYKRYKSTVKQLLGLGFKTIDTTACNKYYKLEGTLYNISPFLFFAHRLLHAPLLRLIKP